MIQSLLFSSILLLTFISSSITIFAQENVQPITNDNLYIPQNITKPSIRIPAYKRDQQFYLLMIISISTTSLNLLGCCYVFYRTIMKSCTRKGLPLAMSYRLPFYTALTDLLIVVFHAMNTTYTAINIRPWLNPQCKIIGVFQQTAICMNYYLYGIIAVSTYLKVNRRIIVDFGRYDYKLFSLIILLTMSTVLPGIFKDGFGQQNLYWCALKAQHNFIYTSFVIGTMLSVVIVTSFCFLQIFLVLARRRCDSLDTLVDNNIQANTMSHYHGFEDKVTRKIASYVLVFMLQWVPVLVFLVTNILQKTSTWTLITVIVGINLGGIGNSLAYIMNESLYKKDSPSSTTSSKGSFWTNGRQHRKLDPNNGELDKQIAKDIIPLKPAAHPKQYQKHWNGVC